VQVGRRGQAEGVLQQQLAGGVVGEVFAAHDVGHALGGVVDHHRELVGPQAVGPQQHEVAHLAGHVLLLRAEAPVGPVQRGVCS